MDKEDIRIPKYVVKVLAEKLREFVEDNEKSFKFHPWQVTSTLNKIQKSIHSGLPERAIHHLHDTGTAEEIMKFSMENDRSVKLGKVKNYLYSQLGLYSNMPRALENGCQIIYPESQLYDAMRRNRIFEIRRLVDGIIHQLEQTSNQNGKAYHIQLNNLNKLSNPKAPKKQALAHCSYTCCLFYGHEKRNEKKKIFKRSPRRMKINFIKRNIKKTSQKHPHKKSTSQNIVPKIYLSPRNMPTLMRSKTLVDSTTQTTWSLKAPRRESLYEDEALDISIGEESMESESDFYCKSDTLNDASMITDQIASEFVQDITQSEIKNEKILSKRKSTRSSAMSKFSDQPKSPTKEITKTSENNISKDLIMNGNSISSLNSIKLEAIEGTVNLFKSMELKTNENTETKTKSKSVLIGSSKNDASDSKCLELDTTQNNVTKSKSVDLEISPGNMVDVKSAEMEVMSNNSNSSNLETVKDSKIHSKSHHSGENKNDNSQSKIHQVENTENSMTNAKPVKIETSMNNLGNTEVQPDLHIESPTHHDSGQPDQENHRVTKKLRRPKKPLLGLISSYARKVALSRCKTSLIESTEDNARKVSLSRCKTSLLESMEDQPGADQEQKECEINENSEKIPAEDQENEMNSKQPNLIKSTSNGLPVEPDDLVAKKEEKDSEDIIKKNSNSKPLRKYFGDSFESILNSENDTTYCPKSLSVSDQSRSESETDEASVRSSIKENDNVSLEYSSHWTMEYSSTEASESEDEEFKEKFREYKKHLLEDDEGIAASCEEESSFGMEHHMKELAVMSAEGKRSLMMIAKQNDGFPTFSYDEDTSYFMDTETFDENLESYQQISYSIVTQEGTYAESGEDSCTRHDESGDNNTPSYEEVPYEEKIESVDDNSLQNKDKTEETNDILCNENTDDVVGIEDTGNEEVSCNINNANEDDGTSYKDDLRNSDVQISGNDERNTSKDHASSNKAIKEAETSLDADDISSNAISKERSYSSISVDEVAYENSQEIETISKILGEFPLRRDNTITENNDILCMEEFSIKDATKINKNNAESSQVSEKENTEQEDEISEENEEISDNEFYSENNVEESKEIENINPEENDDNNNVELCEEVQSKEEDESKECLSEEELFKAREGEYEDNVSKECLSEEILCKDFTPQKRESENEENEENGDNEESCDDLEAIENDHEVLDPDKKEEDIEEIPNADTEINEEDQESQNVPSFKCESTENFNSNEESRKSSITESNEDLTVLNIDQSLVENAAGDNHNSSLEDESNASDEITENVVSVIEDVQAETEIDSIEHEDLSEEKSEVYKTVISEQENMLGEDDTENEVQDDQTTILDSPLCEIDTIEDDDINKEDDEKSNKETATLKVNNQIYKKSHSADEDLKTKRLLKVLSLSDALPFQDIDLMHGDLLEIVDVDGWNMLHLAASKGLEHFLKKVLQHGLSTEDLTDDNHTALQLAVINNNLKCCQILLKHGASLTTEEGSFDENFMETAADVSSNIKDLLENYKCNYTKVQNLAETINQFSSEKKDLSQPLPKNALEILADITIEDEDTEENNVELSTD